MTTRKSIALPTWTFASKVMPLLFNMLSRFVIAFLPRSKRLLILWLQSPSTLILEPKKIKSLVLSLLYSPTLISIHDYWKKHSFDYMDLCQQSNLPLLFNTLSRLVIALLPRSKDLLISWLQSPSEEDKVCHSLHCFPIYKPWSDGTGCHDLHFVKVEPAFSLSSFTFIKRLFSSSSLSVTRWCHLHIWG